MGGPSFGNQLERLAHLQAGSSSSQVLTYSVGTGIRRENFAAYNARKKEEARVKAAERETWLNETFDGTSLKKRVQLESFAFNAEAQRENVKYVNQLLKDVPENYRPEVVFKGAPGGGDAGVFDRNFEAVMAYDRKYQQFTTGALGRGRVGQKTTYDTAGGMTESGDGHRGSGAAAAAPPEQQGDGQIVANANAQRRKQRLNGQLSMDMML